MNLDGSGLTQLTDIAEGACQGRFSPDGEKIVFISPCPKDQLYYPGASLFIMNVDGSEIIPVPSVPGGDFDPSWSPDGKQIAFTSLREEGIAKIFLINLDDYSVTPLGEEGNKASSQPSWSPDGKLLAYVGSDNRIWAIDLASGERHGLTIGGGDFESSEPSWSPDGTAVVFVRRRVNDDTATNWMMAVPYTTTGAMPVEVPNSGLVSLPNYSPDGFWLTFKSWADGNQDIYIMRPSGSDKQIIVSDLAYDFDSTWRPYLLQP
jgi:Tol biopolymer transport system component